MDQNIWHKLLHTAYDNSRTVFAVADGVKRLLYGRSSPTYDVDEPALAYSMDAIKKMHEACEIRGIELIVAIHRDGFFYRSRKAAEEYERKVSVALEAMGVDHFILQSATNKLDYHQFVVAWNDGHPSAEASEIIGGEIVAQLSQRVQERFISRGNGISNTGEKRRPGLH